MEGAPGGGVLVWPKVDGSQRIIIVENALKLGFSGVGIAKTFIHVDIRTTPKMMWCY